MQETQEMWVWSLSQEYPLEEGMTTHFSFLSCRIPWTVEHGGLQSMGSQRFRHAWSYLAYTHAHMESRKMVLMNLFAGQQWRHRHREQTLTPWKESYVQPREHIQKQRHYFANKGPSSQGYGFSCGHVWIWELDCEEGWEPKNWCFWTVVLEKTLESPLDCREL